MEKNENKSRKVKFYIIVALIVIVVPIVFHKVSAIIGGQIAAKMMSMPTKVETVTIAEQDVNETMDFVGRIQAPKEVKIVSRVNGWLQKKYYQDGDYVKKGDKLAVLYTSTADSFVLAEKKVLDAVVITEEKPPARKCVIKVIE